MECIRYVHISSSALALEVRTTYSSSKELSSSGVGERKRHLGVSGESPRKSVGVFPRPSESKREIGFPSCLTGPCWVYIFLYLTTLQRLFRKSVGLAMFSPSPTKLSTPMSRLPSHCFRSNQLWLLLIHSSVLKAFSVSIYYYPLP